MDRINRTYVYGALVLTGLCVLGWVLYSILTQETVPDVVPPVMEEIATTTEPLPLWPAVETIGTSVEGRTISAYTFGTGETHLLFVGGIHGGYEWNSSLLAYEFIEYVQTNPDTIPEHLTVSVIPDLNPDGTFAVTGTEGKFGADAITDPGTRMAEARFNARAVDLNRNFGCKWQPESSWRGNTVSAGTAAFSEPEAQALRDYVLTSVPDAVVFWHSQANNVYASECEEGVLLETLALMNAYANAGSYGAVPVFDAYPITGDAEGWLASIGIPAITVELESFRSIEWERNLAGIKALFAHYATGT